MFNNINLRTSGSVIELKDVLHLLSSILLNSVDDLWEGDSVVLVEVEHLFIHQAVHEVGSSSDLFLFSIFVHTFKVKITEDRSLNFFDES